MNHDNTILTLKVEAPVKQDRIDRWLAEQCAQASQGELSRSRIKTLIVAGHLRVDGKPMTNPALVVREGMVCALHLPAPEPPRPQAEAIPLNVLFEDDDIIIINKPAGMVVHPAPGAMQGTLVNALIAHCGAGLTGIGGEMRPGIVHRLDKDTSGVMVAAKTASAHGKLTKIFAKHTLTRRYTALVWGVVPERHQTINAPIARNPRQRKKMAVQEKGRQAITHIEVARMMPPLASVVECVLETGRTHQIRVHLAHLGHGVVGDATYGRPMRASQMPDQALREALATLRQFPRQALHASHLGFAHPISGEALAFEAELPDDMATLIQNLGAALETRGGKGGRK